MQQFQVAGATAGEGAMTTLEFLHAVRQLIADPRRLITDLYIGAEAEDARGGKRFAEDPAATRWTLWGAFSKVAHDHHVDTTADSVWCRALLSVDALPEDHLKLFSGQHNHADILARLDRVIARLESAVRP